MNNTVSTTQRRIELVAFVLGIVLVVAALMAGHVRGAIETTAVLALTALMLWSRRSTRPDQPS